MTIAVIGADPRVDDDNSRQLLDRLNISGGNTGNLVFAKAVHECVFDGKEYFDWNFDPAVVNDSCDRALLVCANMINPFIDLSALGARIEKLHIPFSAVSIGVQGPMYEKEFNLKPGTLRFLKIVSERSYSFGVRGYTSAAFLEKQGILNWRMIGCPSNFLRLTDNFETHRWNDVINRICDPVAVHTETAFLPYGGDNVFYEYLQKCRTLVGPKHFQWFIQSGWELLELSQAKEESDIRNPDLLEKLGFERGGSQSMVEFIAEHLRTFFSIDPWIKEISRARFSFGARLHGNILAIQSGVPALIVAHDERTRELSEALALPYCTLADFMEIDSFEKLVELAMVGLAEYPVRRKNLAHAFISLLRENGFVPAPALLDCFGDKPMRFQDALPRIQESTATERNRYPEIFGIVESFVSYTRNDDAGPSILSFGCSTGEETETLSLRFPSADILGVDISKDALEQAVQRRVGSNIKYRESTEQILMENAPFDIIFAMSVFCKWPDAMYLEDISKLFPFSQFEKMISILDKYLKVGGLLVIQNSNFNFFDTEVSKKYGVILDPNIQTNGFVHKFSKTNEKMVHVGASDSIYFKENSESSDGARVTRIRDRNGLWLGAIGTSG